MKVKSRLAERINNLCKEKGISYEELSQRSMIPVKTLMNIIDQSTANPGMLIIDRICEGFGITAGDFFHSSEFEDIYQ